ASYMRSPRWSPQRSPSPRCGWVFTDCRPPWEPRRSVSLSGCSASGLTGTHHSRVEPSATEEIHPIRILRIPLETGDDPPEEPESASAGRDHLVYLDGPVGHLGVCPFQRLGLILIGLHQRLDVEAGHVEHTYVPEGVLHLVAPQADVLDDRHDAAEQVRAELDHQRRRVDPLGARLDVHAKGFEDLLP